MDLTAVTIWGTSSQIRTTIHTKIHTRTKRQVGGGETQKGIEEEENKKRKKGENRKRKGEKEKRKRGGVGVREVEERGY